MVYIRRKNVKKFFCEIISYREAINEILKETKRGAIRSEISGAYGWKSAPKVNSRLFGNTLIQAIQTNRRKPISGTSKSRNRNMHEKRIGLSKNKMFSSIKSNIVSNDGKAPSMYQSSNKLSVKCAKPSPKKTDNLLRKDRE